jgi:hypothetical protein
MNPVVVKNIDVPITNWPAQADGLSIAHISDLHLRRWDRSARALQELLLGLQYDLLAITGDFGHEPNRWEQTADLVRRLLAPVYPPCGTYAVLGNHDHPMLAEQVDLNLTFLRDANITLRRNEVPITIAGVEQTDYNRGTLEKTLAARFGKNPVILLAHYPSTVYEIEDSQEVGLQLSGHTHGGQIRLPFLGCLWTNDGIPTRYSRGLHRVNGVPLHVSPGIGVSGPIPLRFQCPPELSLLTLRSANTRSRPAQQPARNPQRAATTGKVQVPV